VPRLQPGWPVTLVGYSQGGGVAVLLALWLERDGVFVERIITLGQPKVTDAEFAARLARLPLMRLGAANDSIPGRPRIAEYVQFGREITLLDGPYIISMQPGDPGYADPRDLPGKLPDYLPVDHATYALRLASKLNGPVYEIPLDAARERRLNPSDR